MEIVCHGRLPAPVRRRESSSRLISSPGYAG
jgi:hypothetical protein